MRAKWKSNGFYDEAMNYIDVAVDTQQVLGKNMTELFMYELRTMIEQGEIIKIELKGKPGEGKSTIGLVLSEIIIGFLKDVGTIPMDYKLNFNNVARDQQEYNKKMMNPELRNNVILIDEYNELEASGENVTAEERQAKTMSDLHRVRYVHTINCSPTQVIDKNSDIILEVIPLEKNKYFMSRMRLYYRMLYGGEERVILLGYVELFVGDMIKNWEKYVRKLVEKNNQTDEEKAIINEWAEKDFFCKYSVKKEEKLALLTKEGIFRPRELSYSEVVLELVLDLEPIAMMGEKITRDTAETNAEQLYRKKKIATSMLGISHTGRRVCGILNGLADAHKYKEKLRKYKAQVIKSGIEPADYHETISNYVNLIEKISQAYFNTIDELKHYAEINKKYTEVADW